MLTSDVMMQDLTMYDWNQKMEAASGDLQERVKRWQESIQPHLEVQASRPDFDICLYKERITETMNTKVWLLLCFLLLLEIHQVGLYIGEVLSMRPADSAKGLGKAVNDASFKSPSLV